MGMCVCVCVHLQARMFALGVFERPHACVYVRLAYIMSTPGFLQLVHEYFFRVKREICDKSAAINHKIIMICL